MALALKKQLEEEARDTGRLPWDRQPGESTQAYARFLAYRDQPFTDRSLRRLDISMTLASRWSRRYAWVKRTQSWDDHLLAAADALGISAQLNVRRAQLDAGLALVTSAHESAAKLDRTKQNAESVAALLDAGARHSRIAVGLPAGEGNSHLAAPSQSSSVAVQFGLVAPGLGAPGSQSSALGSVRVGPAWLTRSPEPDKLEQSAPGGFGGAQPNEAERGEVDTNRPVVQVGEQVLAEGNAGQPRTHREPGKLVNQVSNSKTVTGNSRGRRRGAKRQDAGGDASK